MEIVLRNISDHRHTVKRFLNAGAILCDLSPNKVYGMFTIHDKILNKSTYTKVVA